jgi:UDP-glucuronate 4-epimerase
MNRTSILVTGAAGFVGGHAVERLLQEGFDVVGIDNFDPYYDPAIKRGNVARPMAKYGEATRNDGGNTYRFIEGDYGDRTLLDRLFGQTRFEAVLHLAAQAGVRPSLLDPQKYIHVNVLNLVNLLEAMRADGPQRIVAASSSSVYGNVTSAPFAETAACAQPQSPYGASKRASEIYLGTYAQLYGFKAIGVRPFTVYGPRQRPDMAIASFIRKILLGEEITLFGDGSSARDYTFVSDIVDGLLAALRFPVPYGIYNLGGDHPVSLSELIRAIEAATGCQAKVVHAPMQPGDVERTSADLTAVRRDLGFSPRVSLSEGLRRTTAWVREELQRCSAQAARA